MNKLRYAAVMMMVLGMSFALMAGEGQVRTINIDFRDEVQNTTMNMSLPLSVIETFRPNIEQALAAVHDGEHEINFQEIWNSVKDAGPMDFIEIKSTDADVKVSTTETELIVKVNEKKDGHNIDVTIPLTVCEALFSQGELNLDAIIAALETMVGQDLVRISGDKIHGRVWIE